VSLWEKRFKKTFFLFSKNARRVAACIFGKRVLKRHLPHFPKTHAATRRAFLEMILIIFVLFLQSDASEDPVQVHYNRAVLMQGAQGDLIRRRAYDAYANYLMKTQNKKIAFQRGLDVIRAHVFEVFDILTPPPPRSGGGGVKKG
jgi:hypothetical protein